MNSMSFINSIYRLHDDSVNDDCAIDKMAPRFSQTDNSATIFFLKRPKVFFLSLTGFNKTPLLPLTGFENESFLPVTGFSTSGGTSFFSSLQKPFLTPNWLQIGKNSLN